MQVKKNPKPTHNTNFYQSKIVKRNMLFATIQILKGVSTMPFIKDQECLIFAQLCKPQKNIYKNTPGEKCPYGFLD